MKILISNERHEFLLLHKPDQLCLGKVLLDLPGGKVDEGESIDEAARREVCEETSLSLAKFSKVGGYVESVSGSPVVFVVLASRYDGAVIITSHEHLSHGWYLLRNRLPYPVLPYLLPAIALANDHTFT